MPQQQEGKTPHEQEVHDPPQGVAPEGPLIPQGIAEEAKELLPCGLLSPLLPAPPPEGEVSVQTDGQNKEGDGDDIGDGLYMEGGGEMEGAEEDIFQGGLYPMTAETVLPGVGPLLEDQVVLVAMETEISSQPPPIVRPLVP